MTDCTKNGTLSTQVPSNAALGGSLKKELEAVFYFSASGKAPARDWLRSLTKEEKVAIGADIMSVEMGWPLGMPTVEKIKKDLWTVRTIFNGKWYRVFFTIDKESKKMILLHGFQKQSNKIPQNEIKTAENRQKKV
ncbi:type II toxin-antitoxin system RelE/ParE family toxin [Marispirochaeta aestuarii]|uniref:type II toxin-antitoxin system RelE/ParE family toxin n=1 Tax=Marispirochaeta aestuarii TaxID=1963862 RepID=UPI0029C71D29|nr:type II toxin-antitoxin system RelE/ParE family toxin [Marispirochaeta aestuarii]